MEVLDNLPSVYISSNVTDTWHDIRLRAIFLHNLAKSVPECLPSGFY